MSNDPLPLFRTEAVDGRRPKAYGRIIFVRPLSFAVLTTVAAAVACTIIGFFIWGRYTQHTTLVGQLVPTAGVIAVHAPQAGTIVEKHVSEGDRVSADQLLFLVSSEIYSEQGGAFQQAVGAQLSLQEESLLRQIEHTRFLERQERDTLELELQSLKAEHIRVAAMLENTRERQELSQQTLERYARVAENGAISQEEFNAMRGQHLDAQTRLQSMEREEASFSRQIVDTEARLKTLEARYAAQLADLERAVATARRSLTENESRRLVAIRAPTAGTATGVLGEVGQIADPTRAMLAIVPEHAILEAQLMAPSRAIGFIRPGSPVMLRYDAYPYQRFGHHRGVLRSVSRAAIGIGSAAAEAGQAREEPMYQIRVDLPSQTVNAYGEPHNLQAGMIVQADVLQETRRLYEWVLEPLYSITGKLHQ